MYSNFHRLEFTFVVVLILSEKYELNKHAQITPLYYKTSKRSKDSHFSSWKSTLCLITKRWSNWIEMSNEGNLFLSRKVPLHDKIESQKPKRAVDKVDGDCDIPVTFEVVLELLEQTFRLLFLKYYKIKGKVQTVVKNETPNVTNFFKAFEQFEQNTVCSFMIASSTFFNFSSLFFSLSEKICFWNLLKVLIAKNHS